jgi:CDP-6-deoxy-D-xylo-4-hexulose-3-dehydrase
MSIPHSVDEKALRKAVLDAADAYNTHVHAPAPFVPGVSPVPVSGKYWEAHELFT